MKYTNQCPGCGRRIPSLHRRCVICRKALSKRLKEAQAKAKRPDNEPTEAQLEAMIAEQMASRPAWWDRETRREVNGELPRVVLQGLGVRVEDGTEGL